MAREPVLSVEDLSAFLDEVFPQVRGQCVLEAVGPMTARMRQVVGKQHLRPGGTISGPTMFQIADCAFYAAVLGMIGREALTVTTSLTINFLRKPPPADLIAEARILKLGKLLATGDITVSSAEGGEVVAHATATYAIPPKG
ncbi:MAG: PaaI family thioesterase [Pseudomonadota bacterium]